MLEVIEELFDHYYVKPVRYQAHKDAMNDKRKHAGKKPLL